MALTWTVTKTRRLGPMKVVTGSVAFDDHYDTNGYAVTTGTLGFLTDIEMISFGDAAGYVPQWDNTNGKVKVYLTTAGAAALGEVTHTTSLAALTAVPFIAFGR